MKCVIIVVFQWPRREGWRLLQRVESGRVSLTPPSRTLSLTSTDQASSSSSSPIRTGHVEVPTRAASAQATRAATVPVAVTRAATAATPQTTEAEASTDRQLIRAATSAARVANHHWTRATGGDASLGGTSWARTQGVWAPHRREAGARATAARTRATTLGHSRVLRGEVRRVGAEQVEDRLKAPGLTTTHPRAILSLREASASSALTRPGI